MNGRALVTALVVALAGPVASEELLYGFAAIACGHDDPSDNATKTDYIDEVEGWTSANQVCITGDASETADTLRRAHLHFTPIFLIEPVFFTRSRTGLHPEPQADALWAYTTQIIAESGVPPEDIIFYLADEPAHLGLPPEPLSAAIHKIKETYPDARVLVIEAFTDDLALSIPQGVDYWGFNRYLLRDPGTDPAFQDRLYRALDLLGDTQRLALVLDAQFTPYHAAAGLSRADMAEVALNYERLALSDPRIGLLIGYTWAGGIDGPWEAGARQLPDHVRQTYREIGERLD